MRTVLLLIAVTLFAVAGAGQQTKKPETKKKAAAAKKSPTPSKTKTASTNKPAAKNNSVSAKTKSFQPKTGPAAPKKDDKADLENALAQQDADEKVMALTKFLADHPKAELRERALESLSAARVAAGEAKFNAGDRVTGLILFKKAVDEAPFPYPEKLYNEVLSKVPQSLYFRGELPAAFEAAAAIEKNVAANASQLLTIANFYLAAENGDEAKRIAESVIKLDDKSAAAYQTLGMANRVNFDLEASASAFAKALELDPDSASAKRSLAEMNRALGKPEEALMLFSELTAKDAEDIQSQTGRILSLFDAGKRTEAETELTRALESNPWNVILLAGAAYWYAANGDAAKGIDFAGKAIAAEPRYIWSHIALARALSKDGRLADAEQVLLGARKYGNFPTLEYEIASVRFASGFFQEAVEELQKSFTIKEGSVATKLGRRIGRSAASLPELVAFERQASILQPKGAEDMANAEKLKALLEFHWALAQAGPEETKAAALADAFASGTDKMRYHRSIYAAKELLEKRVAPGKAFELSRAAIASVDDGLSIPVPAAPIMASELYANRTAAIAADRYVLVPEVPKQTLMSIARGRIEQIAGWSLSIQGNNADAIIRFRRAVSVLPEKSAWWRSTLWQLGAALEAEGKGKEALDAYAKSYTAEPTVDAAKYAAIETLYRKVNGGTDGLEDLIGANPVPPPAKETTVTTVSASETKTDTQPPPVVEEKPVEKKEPLPDRPVLPKTETPSIPEKTPEKKETLPAVNDTHIAKSEPPVRTDEKVVVKERGPEKKEPPSDKNKPPEVKTDAPPQPIEKEPEKKEPPPETTEKPALTKKLEAQKPLFDPVVIEVKRSTPPKPKSDIKTESGDEKPKPATNENVGGRPRVVEGKEIVAEPSEPCAISVSEENISLTAGGGSEGILVGIDRGMDIAAVKSISSSPRDVEVVRETEVTGVTGRGLFVIKSLTNKTGVYQVAFLAPCGKKNITVSVR